MTTPHESEITAANMVFVGTLVKDVPQLASAYREHLQDNFGELLPHVFMGDVTRWVVAVSQHGNETEALSTLLARMDAVLGDPSHPCQELVWVSFIENLGDERTAVAAIRALSGPSLRAALEKCW